MPTGASKSVTVASELLQLLEFKKHVKVTRLVKLDVSTAQSADCCSLFSRHLLDLNISYFMNG